MRILARAEQVLISRCMAARGFRYEVTEAVPGSASGTRSFPYAITDVAWARTHGYGGKEERKVAKAIQADPNQRYLRGLSPSARTAAGTALMGASAEGLSVKVPNGMTITASTEGCIADAERNLYGDLSNWFRVKVITMNLRPVREERVRQDRRYAAAVRQWATCMRAAGRPYKNPDEARQEVVRYRERLPVAKADVAETALAVAEATCVTSTRLAGVIRALDHSYSRQIRARYRQELDERWRLENAALSRARRTASFAPTPPPRSPHTSATGTGTGTGTTRSE
ncbi:hypothetical protein [Streptomyces sp. NPDC058657]|uniref:hypothetical protein n=1 Tax=unclassified Streptomyces TaxID=2593676 RepID=UPI003649A61C